MPDYSIYGRILITQAFDFFETPDSLFSSLLKDYSFNLNFSNFSISQTKFPLGTENGVSFVNLT